MKIGLYVIIENAILSYITNKEFTMKIDVTFTLELPQGAGAREATEWLDMKFGHTNVIDLENPLAYKELRDLGLDYKMELVE